MNPGVTLGDWLIAGILLVWFCAGLFYLWLTRK